MRGWVLFLGLIGAPMAAAFELGMHDAAQKIATRNSVLASYAAPISGFSNGAVPSVVLEGRVQRQTWRVLSQGLTNLQVLEPLRAQIQAAGFDIVLDCDARSCGGFDFRFHTEVMPAPSMYVNLRSFRFLTGLKKYENASTEAITVLVSTSPSSAFIQLISVGKAAQLRTVVTSPVASRAASPELVVEMSLSDTLTADGHAVLDGLSFASGTSDLSTGGIASLSELAKVLMRHPRMRVALVGHTDSKGRLDHNIELSLARARAVRTRLVEQYDVVPDQLETQGLGPFAPLQNNATEESRSINRRVEVVLLP